MSRINQWYSQFKSHLKQLDLTILLTYITLSLIGLVIIYSASMIPSQRIFGTPPDHYLVRQGIFFIVGLFIIFIIYNFIPIKLFQHPRFQMIMVLFSLFLLIYTALFGEVVNGQRNWIYIGSIGIQPSEFIKVVVILYLAQVFHARRHDLNNIRLYLAPLLLIAILAVGVILQDLGTGAIIVAIIFAITLFSGVSLKAIGGAVIGAVISTFGLLGINYISTGQWLDNYQLGRFQTFINPFEDPLFQGYQITNSLIAISRGGFTGSGIGEGIMKLGYLPEAHTDFIFAVLAEEFGLIGVLLVITLFIILVFKLLHYAIKTKVMFYRIVIAGVASYFAIQIFLNLGGISKLIPLTGVPLPLISAGGSSFLSFSIAIGISLLVIKQIRKHEVTQ